MTDYPTSDDPAGATAPDAAAEVSPLDAVTHERDELRDAKTQIALAWARMQQQ